MMIKLTSEELSTRLHNKGFKTTHSYRYTRSYGLMTYDDIDSSFKDDEWNNGVPVYTFDALWAALPWQISINGLFHEPSISKSENGLTHTDYRVHDYIYGDSARFADNPTEAAGLLMEWCVDNKHVEVGG